jgi:DNA-binding protein H-NS
MELYNMAKINGLEKLSYAELLDLQKRVEAMLGERRAADAKAVKEQIQELAAKAGFSAGELFGGRSGKRGAAPVKYRNPKDPSQTWSGRGRKPNWLTEAVKKGAKLESFAV